VIGIGISPLLSAAPALAFTPAALGAAVKLWLRGDSYTDASGKVAAGIDLSASGIDFSQATGSKRPTYVASGIGGQPCWQFDGANDGTILVAPAGALPVSTSADVWVVFKADNDPPVSGVGGCWNLGAPGGAEQYITLAGTAYLGDCSSSVKATVAMGAGFFASAHILRQSSKAGQFVVNIDGTDEFTTATNTFSAGTGRQAIGGDFEASNVRLKGLFAEALVVSPQSSAGDRAKILTYLSDRYGIAT